MFLEKSYFESFMKLPSKTFFVDSFLTKVPGFPETFSKAVKSRSSVENLLTPVSVKNNSTDVISGIFWNFQNIQDQNLQLLNLEFTKKELHYRVFLRNFQIFSSFSVALEHAGSTLSMVKKEFLEMSRSAFRTQ